MHGMLAWLTFVRNAACAVGRGRRSQNVVARSFEHHLPRFRPRLPPFYSPTRCLAHRHLYPRFAQDISPTAYSSPCAPSLKLGQAGRCCVHSKTLKGPPRPLAAPADITDTHCSLQRASLAPHCITKGLPRLTHTRHLQNPQTAKLSPILLNRTSRLSFAGDPRPRQLSTSPASNMSLEAKEARRRRSSSLVYKEPPESLEQLSDQSALPNLNAEWVNAKGEFCMKHLTRERDIYIHTHTSR
jgi:hypothetical protein